MVESAQARSRGVAAILKRLFDIVASAAGLCVLLPVLTLLALWLLVAEGRPLIYREYRVGRGGRLFPLHKFRTLRAGAGRERSVAPEDDPRITGTGLWLRRWRLDELPQLFDVLCGHMSLVGPRPMPPAHAAALPAEQLAGILSVRPGITDAAAIHFLAEDAVLAGLDDPEAVYLRRLQPAKVLMQLASLDHWSLGADLRVLARTLALLWSPAARAESARALRRLL